MATLAELGEISKRLPSALRAVERATGGNLDKIKDPAIRNRILAHRAGKQAAYANAAGHKDVSYAARNVGRGAKKNSRAIEAGYAAGGPRASDVAAAKKKGRINPWLLGGGGAALTAAGAGGGYLAGRD